MVEDDYYTAVDDLKTPAEDAGAGFIGEAGFGAGVFYFYACVDRPLLERNLGGDAELAARGIDASCEAAATVCPRGKQASFASRARASYGLVEKGDTAPRTLAAAFLRPVGTDEEGGDPIAASVKRLIEWRARLAQAYGEQNVAFEMDVAGGNGTLAELAAFAADGAERRRCPAFCASRSGARSPRSATWLSANGGCRWSGPAARRCSAWWPRRWASSGGTGRPWKRSPPPCYVAVLTIAAGTLLEDYHTAQVPPARRRGTHHATRREELAAPGGLGTILSRRDYRQEPWHEVALLAKGGGAASLTEIEAALRAPRLVLYGGRKACPLGLPPDPRLVDRPDLGAALAAYAHAGVAHRLLRRPTGPGTLHADHGLLNRLGPGWRVARLVERRDEPGDRRRWQFAVRQELVAVPTGTGAHERARLPLPCPAPPRRAHRCAGAGAPARGRGPPNGTAHRLLWTLFADGPSRPRDFLWREDGRRADRPARLSDPLRPPARGPARIVRNRPAEAVGARTTARRPARFLVARQPGRDGASGGSARRRDTTSSCDASTRSRRASGPARARRQSPKLAGIGSTLRATLRLPARWRAADRRLPAPSHCPRERPSVSFSVLDFDGALTVSDPDLFLAAVRRGFGRAKALGCGLMLIRAPEVSLPGLPPPRPIPLKDRASIVFVEKGQIDVLDGAFVVGRRRRACAPISRSAASPASCSSPAPGSATPPWRWRRGPARSWSGSARPASAFTPPGQPGGARADRLLWQAQLALDEAPAQGGAPDVRAALRRGGAGAPLGRPASRHRGRPGPQALRTAGPAHGVTWDGRAYDREDWEARRHAEPLPLAPRPPACTA